MNFNDMIKKTVLEKFQTAEISSASIIVTLGMAIVLGLFIYVVYRMNTRNGFYNRGFNKTLAVLPVITAGIMVAMGSNLTISLGMVGALSIVRFRNAVKDPVDLMYLFWSIGAGIIAGAGLFDLVILLSLAVALLAFGLDLFPTLKVSTLLVVLADNVDVESYLISTSKEHSRKVKVRSRNISKRGVEWILEMQVKDEMNLVKNIWNIRGVTSVHLMTHDGELRI